MRDQPFLIGGIAGKTAAQMVIDTSLAHPVEGKGDGMVVGLVTGAQPTAPEQFQNAEMRKLRCRADTAMHRVNVAGDPLGHPVHDCRLNAGIAAHAEGLLFQRLDQGGDVVLNLLRLAMVNVTDLCQHLGKAGTTEALFRREIGTAPERLTIRGQEHGQRPAALLTHRRQRCLIQMVKVRAFLTVDLDADELLVHQIGNRLILKALMGHDMAPVTGGIAD